MLCFCPGEEVISCHLGETYYLGPPKDGDRGLQQTVDRINQVADRGDEDEY